MAQFTKRAIVESFFKLLNQKPLDKITVKELVDDCGINRNTFYYHFEDLHALLVFAMNAEVERVMAKHSNAPSLAEGFVEAAQFALDNRRAVYHIYNSVNRVELERYLNSVAGEVIRSLIEKEEAAAGADPEDKALLIRFFKSGLVGIVTSWMENGMKEDPEVLIKNLERLLDGSVEDILKRSRDRAGQGHF